MPFLSVFFTKLVVFAVFLPAKRHAFIRQKHAFRWIKAMLLWDKSIELIGRKSSNFYNTLIINKLQNRSFSRYFRQKIFSWKNRPKWGQVNVKTKNQNNQQKKSERMRPLPPSSPRGGSRPQEDIAKRLSERNFWKLQEINSRNTIFFVILYFRPYMDFIRYAGFEKHLEPLDKGRL